MHVCPSSEHNKQSILHFKENISQQRPKRAIRIARKGKTNSIVFLLDRPKKNTINISPEFLLEANVVIDVLNSYFYKKSLSFIQNKRMKTSKKARYITSEMNKSYKNYKKTNRNPQY